MLRFLVMLLGGLLLPLLAAAQSADEIPEALLAESDAVVRLDETETTYTSPTNVVERHHRQITILRQSAARKGFFTCVVDHNSALKSFAGTVRDAHGKVIRKLKRSELKYSEYSSGLADDAGYYTLEILAPTVPYTVDVEYEIACNDGILAFAPFLPVASTATSLEKAAYTLSVPAGTPLGYKCCRTGEPEKRTEKGCDIYRWQLEQLPAVEAEEMMPGLIDLLPMVFAVPYDFRYGQTQGSMRDWQSFGAWQRKLLEGRDALPDALRREVHTLTDTLATPREKVRALYDYLGATTRYVSIQLGIGGLQPMPAAEVFRTKFGDCKALANYLRALLAECGIDSDYAIIHLDRPRMFRDFASANQANHAILRVPLAADTLWLECTNTEIPFGYIHEDIAGHDAILITREGGVFTTLPRYADTLNRMVRHVELDVAPDGSVAGHVTERYEAVQYEWKMGFPKLDARDRTDYLRGELKLPTAAITRIACTEHKAPIPVIEITYDFTAPHFVNFSGERGFVPLFPFREPSVTTARRRTNDLFRETGYCDTERITIRLPENLRIEALPRTESLDNLFGRCALTFDTAENAITAECRISKYSGTFPREEFEAYKKLGNTIRKAYGASIVVKRQ